MNSLAETVHNLAVESERRWFPHQFLEIPDLRPVEGGEGGDVDLDVPQQPRVLLAEDDEHMRCMLSEELTSAGYQVFTVSNGKDLFHCLQGYRSACPTPDLVISDIRMPGTSGIDVLRRLRRSDWMTPVIMITAFGDAATHAEARGLGAATVLDKPFDMDELVHAAQCLVPTVV